MSFLSSTSRSLVCGAAALTVCAASCAATLQSPPLDPDSWMSDPSVVFLNVIGDSLEVVLIDPLGRSDVWSGKPHCSQIPEYTRRTGLIGFMTPPRATLKEVYMSTMYFRPLDGVYTLRVAAPHPARVYVEAYRAEDPRCGARDSLRASAGDTRIWSLQWSPRTQGDTCWVKLTRLSLAHQHPPAPKTRRHKHQSLRRR